MFAYLVDIRKVKKIIFVILSLPIAFISNILRIIILIVVFYLFGSEFAMGSFHDYSGMLVFVFAFFGLVLLKKVLTEENIDAFMHFAGSALVGESMEDPLLYFDNNVCRAVNLFKTMVEAGVKNVIFSSTAATYGIPERVPIEEEDKISPINPYGESKVMIEKILKDCSVAYGFNYVVLRYFNAAGASDIGEDHSPETHLIPIILQVALGQRESIKIFGTNYETEDGTCVRDYIHILDLADAHILSLKALLEGHQSDIYNLGNGKGFSVNQIIQKAREMS